MIRFCRLKCCCRDVLTLLKLPRGFNPRRAESRRCTGVVQIVAFPFEGKGFEEWRVIPLSAGAVFESEIFGTERTSGLEDVQIICIEYTNSAFLT